MNNVFALRPAAPRPVPLRAQAPSRCEALAGLLRQAARTDGDVLYPLMAALLNVHMDHGHGDEGANARIRDGLDDLELLLALEIERAGLRRSPETPQAIVAP